MTHKPSCAEIMCDIEMIVTRLYLKHVLESIQTWFVKHQLNSFGPFGFLSLNFEWFWALLIFPAPNLKILFFPLGQHNIILYSKIYTLPFLLDMISNCTIYILFCLVYLFVRPFVSLILQNDWSDQNEIWNRPYSWLSIVN